MDDSRARVPPLTAPVADLHLHSTASDGTLSPSEVVRRAVAAGLAAIALTDHDTVAGVAEASAEGRRVGLRVVSGCEFSVKAAWGEMHVLGYCVPLDDPRLAQFLTTCREHRRGRGEAMVGALRRLGVSINQDEVTRQAKGAPIGRPHVARALLQLRVVQSFDEAFDRFLGRGRPAFVAKQLPAFATVADLVRALGGVVAGAHLRERASREVLERLRREGLDAVEIHHPGHPPEVRRRLSDLAWALDLLPTGGSDWHGEAEASPSHSTIGDETVPLAWLDAIEVLSASRRTAA